MPMLGRQSYIPGLMQGFKEELQQWDLTFWSEQLREAKFNISDEQLRPYFSLPNVLDGLFKVDSRALLVFRGLGTAVYNL